MEQLKIRAPFNMMLGYGHVGANLTKALSMNPNIDLSVIPIGIPFLTSRFDELNSLCLKVPPKNAPCLIIWHEHGLIEHCLGGGKHIAYPFFELNEIDFLRRRQLNYVDQIVVASNWAKDVLLNNGITPPIEVAPPGVDREIFCPSVNPPSDTYKFLNVGKFEERKSTKLLADLFNKAFEPTDNVQLIFHCDSQLIKIREQIEEFKKYCGSLKLADKIIFNSPVQTDMALANLMRYVHCGVFLTRAEGFGLPILQMIACGKPVICTNYSGHSQFISDQNALVLPVSKFVSARDNIWFNGVGTWADIDSDLQFLTIEYMQECYSSRKIASTEALPSIENFTWSNTAETIKQLI